MTKQTVSWSELDAGRQCPHKWDLAWHQRWTPPDVSRPLAIGSLGHKALETHYRILQTGGSLADATLAVVDLLRTPPLSPYADTVAWIYNRFVERYGADRQWKILGVEETLTIPLDDRFNLKAIIDLIVEDRSSGAIILIDWKFSSRLLGDRELAFDDQFGLYQAVMRQQGRPVLHCLYGQNRTPQGGQMPRNLDPPLDDWFFRVPVYRTDGELEQLLEEALDDFHRLYDGVETGDLPRHPDSDRCKWRCPFTLPCLHGRKYGPRREVELLEAHGFTRPR